MFRYPSLESQRFPASQYEETQTISFEQFAKCEMGRTIDALATQEFTTNGLAVPRMAFAPLEPRFIQ